MTAETPHDAPAASGITEPPTTLGGTLRRLGPGLIIAGSIVGSGELIATTKTGAQAGISLLWLIVIGCVIKVFVQIELGRYSITHGKTTLVALNEVPGPRGLRANWVLWFWLAMMMTGLAQLGGIVGGVGQALALSFPISGDYIDAIRTPSASELQQYQKWDDALLSEFDLQVHAAAANGTLNNAEAEEFAADVGIDLATQSTEIADAAAARLAALEEEHPGSNAEILAAYAGVSDVLDAGDLRAIETARTELRGTLQKFDQTAFLAAVEALPEPISDEEQARIRHGHAILASQLADLDRRRGRARIALASQEAVAAAAGQQKDAESSLAEVESQPATDTPDDVALRREARQRAAVAAHRTNAAKNVVAALVEPTTWDDRYWALAVAVVTMALLVNGRYGIIQALSTALVVGFTFITIGNVLALQRSVQWSISAADLMRGLSFGLPETKGGLRTALATFGIIGVGASELVTYPYWCIEKGYARFTGPNVPGDAWAKRARGWMRVMLYDAFLSMVVYTTATLAFFVMGVAVLFNEGRDPDGMRMVSTLATAYVPVFGEYAKWLFLIGAVAVLYSTFLVALAGHSRLFTDALKIWGMLPADDEVKHRRSVSTFGVILPLICLGLYWSGMNPVTAILTAATMQAIMLPMLGFGALYFRKTATDSRLAPTRLWDVCLVLSCAGLLIAGAWGVAKLFL